MPSDIQGTELKVGDRVVYPVMYCDSPRNNPNRCLIVKGDETNVKTAN